MTVYFCKNRQHWRYSFFVAGKRYTGYCDDPANGDPAINKTSAKDIEARIRSQYLAGKSQKRPNPRNYTVAQAFAVYLAQCGEGNNKKNQTNYVHELVAWFRPETLLTNITNEKIAEYISFARKKPIRFWTGGAITPKGKFPLGKTADSYWKISKRTRSDSTINRYLDCLRKTLRLAHINLNHETGLPLLLVMPKVPELEEPNELPRPISPDNLEAIIAACPEHLADAIRLTVLMGFRKAEVFGLTRNHFDKHNRGIRLASKETKGNRAEFIPTSGMAFDILCRLDERAKKLGQQHLILYRTGGKKTEERWRPIKNPRRAWNNALKKLGLEGRHVFHNTKATFVTAIAQKMPDSMVRDLARHKDYKTTQRYIRLADSLRREAIEAATGCFNSEIILQANAPKTLSTCTQKLHTEAYSFFAMPFNSLKIMVGATGFEPATPSPPD